MNKYPSIIESNKQYKNNKTTSLLPNKGILKEQRKIKNRWNYEKEVVFYSCLQKRGIFKKEKMNFLKDFVRKKDYVHFWEQFRAFICVSIKKPLNMLFFTRIMSNIIGELHFFLFSISKILVKTINLTYYYLNIAHFCFWTNSVW